MCTDIDVDGIDEPSWNHLAATFSDANIYQTWPYEAVRSGESNLSHLVISDGSRAVAAVQARTVQIPYVKFGMAYVRWGPLTRFDGCHDHLDRFRRAIHAIRGEYVDRRGLSVRIVPRIYGSHNDVIRPILESEGYGCQPTNRTPATVVMDLRPDLDELNRGLHHKWRYHLNKARKQGFIASDGEDEESFVRFERIYGEMVKRKRFVSFTDVTQLKTIQRRLPANFKMRVFLCSFEGEYCAGGVCSAVGDTAIYLFGATSNLGIRNYASYLLHWNMLAWARSRGCTSYDLNGIDPDRNPGGYQFKSQLAAGHGQQVSFIGSYDAYPNMTMRGLIAAGDSARRHARRARQVFAHFS